MKLNIYSGNDIIKVYETGAYNLKFGTIEDVANAVNLDNLKTGSNAEYIQMAVNLVLNSMDTVKNLMKDIFKGITDEELRNSSVKEMALVLVDVVTYTMQELSVGSRGN